VAGSSGGAASAVALGSGGAVAMAVGLLGVADGVDFGCHFLRSGVGGTSVVDA
jgi:hypothetical protein